MSHFHHTVNKNVIMIIVSFAMFMESVDATILNTAIPTMAQSFHVPTIDLKLALISYLITLAIFIPISGWIGDKFGVKKVFMSAIAIFTLSSFWCGCTHTLWELILARITQGIGGSLTIPIGRLIIIRTCERHELISKMSIVVMVAAVGLLLGPLLGGIITQWTSWPWIFWVNIPFGISTLFLSFRLLPEMPKRPVFQLDQVGFLLFGCGLAALTLGLSMLSETNIQSSQASLVILLAIALLSYYVLHSREQKHPIVHIQLLRIRTFRTSVLGNLISRLGLGGIPFLIPILLQTSLGFSPQLSGLLLTPIAIGVFISKSISLHFLRFLGYKKFLILNTSIISVSILLLSIIQPHSSLITIGAITFLYGCFMSSQFTGMNSLAYANIAQDDVSAATSIMSTIQQLSQSFGVAVAALFIQFFSIDKPGYITIHTLHQTFLAMGFLTFLSIIIFIPLQIDDGLELLTEPSR